MPHASRVALITGCGKPVGIGNSTARALAAKGVAIVVSDVRPAGVANEHNAPGDLAANWGGVDSLGEPIEEAGGTAMAVPGGVSRAAAAGRRGGELPSRSRRLALLGRTPRERAKAIPVGRCGSADEVASMTAYIASDEAAFVTGQAIGVDGGW